MGCSNPSGTPMFGCCGGVPIITGSVVAATTGGQPLPTPATAADLANWNSALRAKIDAEDYIAPSEEFGWNVVIREFRAVFQDRQIIGWTETVFRSAGCFSTDIFGNPIGWFTPASAYTMARLGHQMWQKARWTSPSQRGLCVKTYETGTVGTLGSACGRPAGFGNGSIIGDVDALVTSNYEVPIPALIADPDPITGYAISNSPVISADQTIPPPCNLAP